MAVAVLVQFEKDDDAKDFVKGLRQEGVLVNPVGSFCENGWYVPVKLRGVWKVPTQFCDPSDGHAQGGGKLAFSYTRGQKYGWWVHTKCGRPSRDWGQGGNWDYALGTNLLPQSISGEPRRQGWEKSPLEWTWLIDTLPKED
jgi:hypothetical protein